MILFWGIKGDHGYMSNFYVSPFDADGCTWQTVEHYYQAKKSKDKSKAALETFAKYTTPGKAKRAGQRIDLREDWEDVKINVMLDALRYKFNQNEDLKKKLLDTENEVLHEDSPMDFIWGWQNNGKDLLGKCLMKVRGELRGNKEEAKEEETY